MDLVVNDAYKRYGRQWYGIASLNNTDFICYFVDRMGSQKEIEKFKWGPLGWGEYLGLVRVAYTYQLITPSSPFLSSHDCRTDIFEYIYELQCKAMGNILLFCFVVTTKSTVKQAEWETWTRTTLTNCCASRWVVISLRSYCSFLKSAP